MANSLTALNPEVYARQIMPILKRESVAMKIATTRFEPMLAVGDTFNKQYVNDSTVSDYTKYTDLTMQDNTATNEYGSIDQSRAVIFNIDVVDKRQNLPSFVEFKSKEAAYRLRNDIDQKFLQEVANADLDVDDGDIGGTAGNPIVLSASNAFETMTQTFADLGRNEVESDAPWYCCVDYKMAAVLAQSFAANGFRIADNTLVNGYTGNAAGLNIYLSENLYSTVNLGIATNVSEGDTVVFNGVTFTFNATPSGAGSVDLGSDAATSVDNLVAAINDSGTAGTTYIQLSTANRRKLANQRVVAADNTTYLTITSAGRMTLSETLSAAADGFGAQTLQCLYGKQGVIDLVVQEQPNVEERKPALNLSTNYIAHTLYGVKSFQEGTLRSGNLKIQGQATTI